MPRHAGSALVALSLILSGSALSHAQPLGTFRWQFQPYCNVVTVAVVQMGDTYTLDGTDDMCGGPERAPVSGLAYVSASGAVRFGLTVVAPGPVPVHVIAAIGVPSLNGSWADSLGRSGTFAFNPAAPGGPIRPSTAPLRVSVGFQNWVPFGSTDNVTLTRFINRLGIAKATAGINLVGVSPSLPVAMDGRRLNLLGVEFCYLANPSAVLSAVNLYTNTHVNDVGGFAVRASDGTARTDEACRFYAVTAPYELTVNDMVSLYVTINFISAGATFRIGRTTFIVEPTTTPATAPDELPATGEGLLIVGEGSPPLAEPQPKRK